MIIKVILIAIRRINFPLFYILSSPIFPTVGWMLKMTIDHPEQLEELMSQEEYEEYISKASDS